MDIYDEQNQQPLSSNNVTLIEFDFSKEMTLYEMIDKVKTTMSTNPTNPQIYIVCGRTVAQNDYIDFFGYLTSVYAGFFDERIYIRGYIHYDFIQILGLYKCIVTSDTKLVHDITKTHKFWDNFKFNPTVQNRFIQRLNTAYINVLHGYFGLDELTNLGIVYETF